MCTLGAGTVLTATFTDGRSVGMRIDSVTQGAQSYWNGSTYVDMSDVYYNSVSWVVDHAPNVVGARLLAGANACTDQVCNVGGAGYAADPYCCNNSWDSLCVAEANAICAAPASTVGRPVCGMTANTKVPQPVKALFVAGVWDTHWGQEGQGGKIATTQQFTIACRGIGAIAKCVDMGYKPWNPGHDNLHQTCVRAVRADYCGDGASFTTDGRQIDISDYLAENATQGDEIQISSGSTDFNYEATWDTTGARCLEYPAARANGGVNAYNGQTFNEYYAARTTEPNNPLSNYCYVEPPGSGPGCFSMSSSTGLIANATLWVD